MTLPNFLIVGAQKCGTTSLHEILSEHPETGMSDTKEVNYFTFDAEYRRGLTHYKTFFQNANSNCIAVGESSPGYMCTPGVPERIRNDLGEIKIVMILRDPIKRAFSQYWDNRRHLNEHLSEIQIVDKWLEASYKPGRRGYFSRGVYSVYLNKFIQLFGRKSIHVIILEDLIKNEKKELRILYEFLGLDVDKGLQNLPPPSNSSTIWNNPVYKSFFTNPSYVKYLPKRGKRILFFGEKVRYKYELPNVQIVNKLKEFYKPYNIELSKLLGNPLSKWM